MYFHIWSAVLAETGISESKGVERNKQEYLESWEYYHIKKRVQQDQAIPSSTKASSMERHHIVSQACPKWERSCNQQLVHGRRKRLRPTGFTFRAADPEKQTGEAAYTRLDLAGETKS